MKIRLIKLFTVLSCLFALTNISIAAGDIQREFEIPFEFTIKNKVFPAGKYSIERLSPSNPNFLVLKQVDGKLKTILLVQNTGGKEFSQDSRLLFNRDENSYTLEGVWAFGEKYGQKFLPNEKAGVTSKGEKFILIYRHKT